MKKLSIAAAALMAASMVNAGELAYVAPESTMLDAPAAMGAGIGNWLIPLVILGVLVLSLSNSCDPRERKCFRPK